MRWFSDPRHRIGRALHAELNRVGSVALHEGYARPSDEVRSELHASFAPPMEIGTASVGRTVVPWSDKSTVNVKKALGAENETLKFSSPETAAVHGRERHRGFGFPLLGADVVLLRNTVCFTLIGTSDKIVALVRFNDLQPGFGLVLTSFRSKSPTLRW